MGALDNFPGLLSARPRGLGLLNNSEPSPVAPRTSPATAPQVPDDVDWSRLNQRSVLLPKEPWTQWDVDGQCFNGHPFSWLSAAPPRMPSRWIGDLARDGLMGIGMSPYNANHFTTGIGNVISMTPLAFPVIAADTIEAKRRGDDLGVITGMAGMIPGVAQGVRAAAREAGPALRSAVEEADATLSRMRSAGLPSLRGEPAPTGSLNPLDNVPVRFRGKEPAQFTPEDWKDFGDHYGTPNLGPLSPPVTYKDVNGNDFIVPGGTEGKWTYLDLLHMKANPINPANIDRELHADMQRKLGRTMTPENLSDADVWNGLVFGITSPNNPLFPNQMTASRLRLRSPEMIDDLASMVPWKPGDKVTPQQRKVVSDNIAQRFGLAAADKGGLGIRGSADYSRVGEMAQMFKLNPNFFRKRPDEDWSQAVERISSQISGLSMKTGALGMVWQDPANAAIAAVDRHMARELDRVGGIFEGPAQRTAWQNRGIARWNKCHPDDPAKSWTDLMSKRGSDGFVGEMLLDHVSNAATNKFRMKGGEVNPNIPEHLASANWVREPESVVKMGEAYKRALAVNQKLADESGLNLFMSQWMEWDRIRHRFELHENMFPGLSNLPAPSLDQLRAVDLAHKLTGHKTYTKGADSMLRPTRPYKGPISQMGYLGLAASLAAPALTRKDEEEGAAD